MLFWAARFEVGETGACASAWASSGFQMRGESSVESFPTPGMYDELAIEQGELRMRLDMPAFIGLTLGREKNAFETHQQLVYGNSEALPEDDSCDVRKRLTT